MKKIIATLGLFALQLCSHVGAQTLDTALYPTYNAASPGTYCWQWTAFNTVGWGACGSSSTGTVTSVSVVTANGISGSVATATTTPAITLTLGAITPSSVAASGTLAMEVSGGNSITFTGTPTGARAITVPDSTGTMLTDQNTPQINSAVLNAIPFWSSTANNGTLNSVSGIQFDGTSVETLGVSGSSVGGLKLNNATSGSVTVQPVTGALGSSVLSLPAATDQLIARATTDTLTNKTFDTGGTGNVFKIAGTQISSISGNTSKVGTTSGTLTNGHCPQFDASGNIVDSGTTNCGGGSPSISADQMLANFSGSSGTAIGVSMPTSGTNGCAGAANALQYNTSTHALGCGSISAGAATLSSLTAATGANTLSSGDNDQTWNWTQTTNGTIAFAIGENAAATNGTTTQYLHKITTLASSTTYPFAVATRGGADNIQVDKNGAISIIGATGTIGGGTTGSAITVTGGQGASTSAGGAISITSGAGGSSSGSGGALTLKSGSATSGASSGGTLTLQSGDGSGGNGAGSLNIKSGTSTTSGAGGAITVTAQSGGTTGASGNITLVTQAGGATSGNSGTIALQTGSVTSGTVGNIDFQTAGTVIGRFNGTTLHFNHLGTTPTVATTDCAGNSGTASLVGTDQAMAITTGTGTFSSCKVTFAKSFTNAPVCNVNSSVASDGVYAITAVAVGSVTVAPPGNITASSKLYLTCASYQ